MIEQYLYKNINRITIFLLAMAIICLAFVFQTKCFFPKEYVELTNNILIGIATNLIGICITIRFVQVYFDKQEEQIRRQKEKDEILNASRFLNLIIGRYLKCAYLVTVPCEKRGSKLSVSNDFLFKDMHELYSKSIYVSDPIDVPVIVLFFKEELRLRDAIINQLNHNKFDYHQELIDIFTQFVHASLYFNYSEVIIRNYNLNIGDEKLKDFVQNMIKNSSIDFVENVDKGTIKCPHILVCYYFLYKQLKIQIDALIKYQMLIDDLNKE